MKGSRLLGSTLGLGLGLGLALATLALAGPVAAQNAPSPQPAVEQPGAGPAFSPRGAFFRSLLIPGWGQAKVGAPGRGAVYFAAAAGSFWMTYLAREQLRDAEREQDWLRSIGDLSATEETEFVLARGRHFEDWAALSIFIMFLSGADAYVSAYLSDFDERVGVIPGAAGDVRLEARIPLGGTP